MTKNMSVKLYVIILYFNYFAKLTWNISFFFETVCEICGEHQTCYFEEGEKRCKCKEGYADDKGTCKRGFGVSDPGCYVTFILAVDSGF
ncbi:hypothetical protein CEXT_38381 [Caerostris extrusa]|uniref:EGF-like domain-containing protein n=1 Tax=Caerostris extrusa TaxID=172846 RepID=A0AAV4TUS2_CAEEX|nr:hypothetical protein CEXT_38381 [Caerostris extrusa]